MTKSITDQELEERIEKYLVHDIPLSLLVESYNITTTQMSILLKRLQSMSSQAETISNVSDYLMEPGLLDSKKIFEKSPQNGEIAYFYYHLDRLKELTKDIPEIEREIEEIKNKITSYDQEIVSRIESFCQELNEYQTDEVTTEIINGLLKKHHLDELDYDKLSVIYKSYNSDKEQLLLLENKLLIRKKYLIEYEDIREIIITHNIGLVNLCLRKFFTNVELDIEEAQLFGIEGLVKALNEYDYQKNRNFDSFAITYIIRNIKEHFQELYGMSWNDFITKQKIKEARLNNSGISELSSEEIEKSDELLEQIIPESSLIKEESEYITDTIPSSIDIEEEYLKTSIKEELEKTLSTLDEVERKIIIARFGLDGRVKTLDEIAKELGETKEKIRTLESRALRHLRHPKRSFKLRQSYENSSSLPKESIVISNDKIYGKLLYLLNSNVSKNGVLAFMNFEGVEWTEKDLVDNISILNKIISFIIEKESEGMRLPAIILGIKEDFNLEFTEDFINNVIKNYSQTLTSKGEPQTSKKM